MKEIIQSKYHKILQVQDFSQICESSIHKKKSGSIIITPNQIQVWQIWKEFLLINRWYSLCRLFLQLVQLLFTWYLLDFRSKASKIYFLNIKNSSYIHPWRMFAKIFKKYLSYHSYACMLDAPLNFARSHRLKKIILTHYF